MTKCAKFDKFDNWYKDDMCDTHGKNYKDCKLDKPDTCEKVDKCDKCFMCDKLDK